MDLNGDLCGQERTELLKANQLDAIMAEATVKRRKTRRGKKKPYRRDGSYDIGKNFFDESQRVQNEIQKVARHKKMLRPSSSPKAPMNSTQFLIKDSGNDKLFIETADFTNHCSPDHMIADLDTDSSFEETSLYDTQDECKKSFGEDDEYIPMYLDEMTDFMGREFERDLQNLNSQYDTRLEERKIYFKHSSHEMVVDELLKLENEMRSLEQKRMQSTYKSNVKNEFEKEIERLNNENELLRQENQLLKNLIP